MIQKRNRLDLTMVGEVVVHDGFGVTFGVVGEHSLEVMLRHAGPADEVLAGIDREVAEDHTERFESVFVVLMPWFR